MTISEFFAQLDQNEEYISLDDLKRALDELQINESDIAEYAHFSDDGYQRNLIHEGPRYEAFILCWKNGQRSPIHDHRGSACGVTVIKGVVTETVFKHTENGWIYATESRELGAGGVCGSNDMDTHQLSNLQTDNRDAITMHIYSPPLAEMGLYSIENNTVTVIESPRNAPRLVS